MGWLFSFLQWNIQSALQQRSGNLIQSVPLYKGAQPSHDEHNTKMSNTQHFKVTESSKSHLQINCIAPRATIKDFCALLDVTLNELTFICAQNSACNDEGHYCVMKSSLRKPVSSRSSFIFPLSGTVIEESIEISNSATYSTMTVTTKDYETFAQLFNPNQFFDRWRMRAISITNFKRCSSQDTSKVYYKFVRPIRAGVKSYKEKRNFASKTIYEFIKK